MILYICRGLPGSGKTTKALEWLEEGRMTRARVNRDDLRSMIYNGIWLGPDKEKMIIAARDNLIRLLLQSGLSIVCDDTNLAPSVMNELMTLARSVGAEWHVWDLTTVPLDECIRRDAGREKPVGAIVIQEMHQKWLVEH